MPIGISGGYANLYFVNLSFVFCVSPFVVLHYGPFTVLSFAGTKFDILWHAKLGPMCGILYIFC